MIRGRVSLALIAMVSSLIISGCMSTPPQATPTPTAMPTATPVPTTSMPTPVPTIPTPPAVYFVEIVNAPATAAAGQSFTVSWRVNSPVQETINNTAVYYGPDSKSENLTLSSYPSRTTPQSGTIPSNFSANITIGKTGIFYFRAHAIIDGTNYWSDEKTVNITIPKITSVITPTATVTSYGYGGYGY